MRSDVRSLLESLSRDIDELLQVEQENVTLRDRLRVAEMTLAAAAERYRSEVPHGVPYQTTTADTGDGYSRYIEGPSWSLPKPTGETICSTGMDSITEFDETQ